MFLSPTAQGQCPDTLGQPANQDPTFDLAYAAPGSLFRDPTSESGRLLMIYEGTNACVGNPGGDKLDQGAYESTGIATSLDGGRAWPRYRANDAPFANVDLPFANPSQGPRLPAGALGARVCIGNDCDSRVPRTYGRYEILTPPVPLDAALMSVRRTSRTGSARTSATPSRLRLSTTFCPIVRTRARTMDSPSFTSSSNTSPACSVSRRRSSSFRADGTRT